MGASSMIMGSSGQYARVANPNVRRARRLTIDVMIQL
jgi:hypothetical protein